jgi:hypothetical protein
MHSYEVHNHSTLQNLALMSQKWATLACIYPIIWLYLSYIGLILRLWILYLRLYVGYVGYI